MANERPITGTAAATAQSIDRQPPPQQQESNNATIEGSQMSGTKNKNSNNCGSTEDSAMGAGGNSSSSGGENDCQRENVPSAEGIVVIEGANGPCSSGSAAATALMATDAGARMHTFTTDNGNPQNGNGYARSRLFRNPNEVLVPQRTTTVAGVVKEKEVPPPPSPSREPSQSARETPAKKGNGADGCEEWPAAVTSGSHHHNNRNSNYNYNNNNNNNKSCPVARRQFFGSQQNNAGQPAAGQSQHQKDRCDSLSLGSRDSVLLVSGPPPPFDLSNQSPCSSRASWQLQQGGQQQRNNSSKQSSSANKEHWQLFAVTLHRASQSGFGIAISGGSDCGGILVSDVIPSGPAFGLLQVGDRITSCNGYPLEHADYGSAVAVMKESQQLNMIVKRRVPVPFVEFEQRTLKFTLSKSRKKDDFGIVLGCRFYIKEILNPKLAEKEPGLREGDTVLRVNGQSLEGATLDEASRLLQRSREKLSLVVQRDVRRGGGGGGSRWPSQTTVYERLGSVQATPRQSPTPAHYGFAQPPPTADYNNGAGGFSRKGSAGTAEYSPAGFKRFSDPMTGSIRTDHHQYQQQHQHQQQQPVGPQQHHYAHPPLSGTPSAAHPQQSQSMLVQMHNNGRPMVVDGPMSMSHSQQQQQHGTATGCPSPYHQHANQQQQHQRVSAPQPLQLLSRPQSQTPSSVNSLPIGGCGHQQQQTAAQQSASSSAVGSAGAQTNAAHYGQQQAPPAYEQRFGHQPNQLGPPMPSHHAARQIRSVHFHKGPHGVGIRVVGGNQVGIFVSAVQEQSPADRNGIRVGDRIHGINGVSIAGVTREEAFDFLLSLGEQQISLAVEYSPEEFSQVKAGKFGDSFYIRTHFSHTGRQPVSTANGGRGGQQPMAGQQQPAELSFQPGDIFHVTDTLFGGSPGFWQVTKVYSAVDADMKTSGGISGTGTIGPGGGGVPYSGIIPHAKVAEQMMRQQQRMVANEKGNYYSTGGTGGEGQQQQSSGGGTLSRSSLFRKKLSFSSRKLFGGGGQQQESQQLGDDLLSGGSADQLQSSGLCPPAYERVALKRPAFHRPVVLYGPLADVARQQLLAQHSLRFGAPFPSTPSASGNNCDLLLSASATASADQRAIRLAAVDAVMAAQKHCVLCVGPGSVERLQLAQYAPIVVLIDVDSRSRVRDLRSKSGASTQSAKKLLELAQRIKKQHSHLLTATLDASKEDQWFEALRALIFHLQERRVWMPEFQPELPPDDLVLFPLPQPGGTPTSDSGDKSDYGGYDPSVPAADPTSLSAATAAGTLTRQLPLMGAGSNNVVYQQQQSMSQRMAMFSSSMATVAGTDSSSSFLVPNPAYTLARGQSFGTPGTNAGNGLGTAASGGAHQPHCPQSARSPTAPVSSLMVQSQTGSIGGGVDNCNATSAATSQQPQQSQSARTSSSPFLQQQQQMANSGNGTRLSPRQESAANNSSSSRSQLLAQLTSELRSPPPARVQQTK